MVKYSIYTGAKRIKSKTTLAISGTVLGISGLLMALVMPLAANAAGTQVIVTPTNTQGWSTSDTRTGGAVNFVADSSAPGNPHNGALQLTTDATTAAKAQYMHGANTPLSNVNELSYYTKQNPSAFAGADASYQLPVCLLGFTTPTLANPSGCNGFTTLVYEPYENGVVTPGVWQPWDVSSVSANMWSSRTVTSETTCNTVAGSGGAPFYNLTTIKTICPDAVVVGFGVNIGTFNPSYNVETDLFDFNGTTYNFEPFASATDKDQCKNGGWMNVTDNNGNSFKNQGDCVSYVATHGKNQANG